MCKTEIMAFVREAEVGTLSAERELAFVEALCGLGNLADARNFLSYNIELLPEVLNEVKHRAEQEAVKDGVSLQEKMAQRGVSYASIYDHQVHKLDKMRKKRA